MLTTLFSSSSQLFFRQLLCWHHVKLFVLWKLFDSFIFNVPFVIPVGNPFLYDYFYSFSFQKSKRIIKGYKIIVTCWSSIRNLGKIFRNRVRVTFSSTYSKSSRQACRFFHYIEWKCCPNMFTGHVRHVHPLCSACSPKTVEVNLRPKLFFLNAVSICIFILFYLMMCVILFEFYKMKLCLDGFFVITSQCSRKYMHNYRRKLKLETSFTDFPSVEIFSPWMLSLKDVFNSK